MATLSKPPINGKSHRPVSALVGECYGLLVRDHLAANMAHERRNEVDPDTIAFLLSDGPEALMALLEESGVSRLYDCWNETSERLSRALEDVFLAPAATITDVLDKLRLVNVVAQLDEDPAELPIFDEWLPAIQTDLERLVNGRAS